MIRECPKCHKQYKTNPELSEDNVTPICRECRCEEALTRLKLKSKQKIKIKKIIRWENSK